MELSRTTGEKMEAARQLEKAGRLEDAAAIYQKLFNSDPASEQVIGRLLVMYRKLKDYQKELSVLNDAIAAYQRRQRTVKEKWIQSHPKAASIGKSMLRELEKGDNALTGLGGNLVVDRWMKRREVVTGRITGKKRKGTPNQGKAKKVPVHRKKAEALEASRRKTGEKHGQRKEAAAVRKKAAQDHKEAAAREKRELRESKAAETSRRKEVQERRKAEAARQRIGADREKAQAQDRPSLFVVILRYLVPIEEIEAVMKQHMVYLDKHYEKGDFLVSGRQVPRTGGVILARAKNRNALEKTIKQDPFVKRKLASADIIEFTASQVGKGLEGWLKMSQRPLL